MAVTLGHASSRRVAEPAPHALSSWSARRKPRASHRQTCQKLSSRPGLVEAALVCPSKVLREEEWFLRRRLAWLKREVDRSNAHKTPGSDSLVTECMWATATQPTPPEHVPAGTLDPWSHCEMARSLLIAILPEMLRYTNQKNGVGLRGAGALTQSWPIRSEGRRGRKPA